MKVVNKILEPFKGLNVIAYLDIILIMSINEDMHIQDVKNVCKSFGDANLLLIPKKSQIATPQAKFLGITLNA